MRLPHRILLRWLQLAAVTAVSTAAAYLAAQQLWRSDANDPQIQLAREAALQLANGRPPGDVLAGEPPIDFATSVSPFVIVLDGRGEVIASSGRLHGSVRSVPAGVLDHVRASGEEAVSWQPEPGVRIASVVVRYPGGFVVAGRSLALSEGRTKRLGELLLLGWLASAVGLAVVVAATEFPLGGR